MPAEATMKWEGRSGKKYQYWVYKVGTKFKTSPGNFIFARETKPLTFAPVYIGQTNDISERFDGHPKMPCIQENGATHIHIHSNTRGEAARLAEEADLISMWNPACND